MGGWKEAWRRQSGAHTSARTQFQRRGHQREGASCRGVMPQWRQVRVQTPQWCLGEMKLPPRERSEGGARCLDLRVRAGVACGSSLGGPGSRHARLATLLSCLAWQGRQGVGGQTLHVEEPSTAERCEDEMAEGRRALDQQPRWLAPHAWLAGDETRHRACC
eukprot:3660815-Rhodomonas_salina.1